MAQLVFPALSLPQPSPRGWRLTRLPHCTGRFIVCILSNFSILLDFNKHFRRAWQFLNVLKSFLLAASPTHPWSCSVFCAFRHAIVLMGCVWAKVQRGQTTFLCEVSFLALNYGRKTKALAAYSCLL